MSWITEIAPERAEGRLNEIYTELQASRVTSVRKLMA